MSRPRIFISGPITPRGIRPDCGNHPAAEYIFNIQDMVFLANQLMKKGWAPYCPGVDFLNFFLSKPADALGEIIYEVDLSWLEVSDAILMLPRWEHASGCQKEYSRAVELGMPIYTYSNEVPDA